MGEYLPSWVIGLERVVCSGRIAGGVAAVGVAAGGGVAGRVWGGRW